MVRISFIAGALFLSVGPPAMLHRRIIVFMPYSYCQVKSFDNPYRIRKRAP
jgi:hypothetical protein